MKFSREISPAATADTAPRLVLRCEHKKQLKNLGALFFTAAAKPKGQRKLRNSRIPRKSRIPKLDFLLFGAGFLLNLRKFALVLGVYSAV